MADVTLQPGTAGIAEVKGRSLWADARHRFHEEQGGRWSA